MKRTFWPTTLALAAVAGLAWFATARTWGNGMSFDDTLPTVKVRLTGSEAAPLVAACALVVIAAAFALLVTPALARKVIAGIAFLASVGGFVAALVSPSSVEHAVRTQLEASPGVTDDIRVYVSNWHWWAVAALAATALISLAALRWSASWPTMSSRYDAPGEAQQPESFNVAEATSRDLWKAFDEGRDPTE